MPRATPTPAATDDGSSTAAAPEPSMTSVSMDVVTDPSPVNTESAGVEDAESSQGGKPAQPEPGKDLTAEEEALLGQGSVGSLQSEVRKGRVLGAQTGDAVASPRLGRLGKGPGQGRYHRLGRGMKFIF